MEVNHCVELHKLIVKPMANAQTPGAYYRGMRKVGIDCTVMDVSRFEAHQHFGRSSAVAAKVHFHKCRNAQSEICRTLEVTIEFAICLWRLERTRKRSHVEKLWEFIPEDALLIEDRGFFSFKAGKTA